MTSAWTGEAAILSAIAELERLRDVLAVGKLDAKLAASIIDAQIQKLLVRVSS